MPSFFLEYPPVLVLVMALVGYLLGMILGYLFWGIYKSRADREQLDVDRVSAELKNLQTTNRSLKGQLAGRS